MRHDEGWLDFLRSSDGTQWRTRKENGQEDRYTDSSCQRNEIYHRHKLSHTGHLVSLMYIIHTALSTRCLETTWPGHLGRSSAEVVRINLRVGTPLCRSYLQTRSYGGLLYLVFHSN